MSIGNTKIHQLIRNGKQLSELEAWYKTFDGNTKAKILDWVRDEQLIQEGEDSLGDTIGLYSYATEFITNGEKEQGDPYTLYDTGETYRSLYLIVLRDAIVIEGDFTKMQDQDWWSENIYRLNEYHVDRLRELVKNSFIAYVRKVLFRGL
jgi:hypothetical protein